MAEDWIARLTIYALVLAAAAGSFIAGMVYGYRYEIKFLGKTGAAADAAEALLKEALRSVRQAKGHIECALELRAEEDGK